MTPPLDTVCKGVRPRLLLHQPLPTCTKRVSEGGRERERERERERGGPGGRERERERERERKRKRERARADHNLSGLIQCVTPSISIPPPALSGSNRQLYSLLSSVFQFLHEEKEREYNHVDGCLTFLQTPSS